MVTPKLIKTVKRSNEEERKIKEKSIEEKKFFIYIKLGAPAGGLSWL